MVFGYLAQPARPRPLFPALHSIAAARPGAGLGRLAAAALVGVACGAAATEAAGLRPVQYAMLDALESAFVAHRDSRVAAFEAALAALAERHRALRVRLDAERESIAARQAEDAGDLARRGAALGERVEAFNRKVERGGGASEPPPVALARLQPELDAAREALSRIRDELRELAARQESARQHLAVTLREIESGTHPLAQAMDAARRDLKKAGAARRAAIDAEADSYRRERADLDAWVSAERERIGKLVGKAEDLLADYRAAKATHDARAAGLAARIEAYNARLRSAADLDEDERAALSGELEAIGEARGALGADRELALSLHARLAAANDDVLAATTRLEVERDQRERALTDEHERLRKRVDDARRELEAVRAAGLEQRTALAHEVDTRRAALEAARAGLTREFGPEPDRLMTAIATWLRHPDGATDPPTAALVADARWPAWMRAREAMQAGDRARLGIMRGIADLEQGEREAARARQALAALRESLEAERAALEAAAVSMEARGREARQALSLQADAVTRETDREGKALRRAFELSLAIDDADFGHLQGALLSALGRGPGPAGAGPSRGDLTRDRAAAVAKLPESIGGTADPKADFLASLARADARRDDPVLAPRVPALDREVAARNVSGARRERLLDRWFDLILDTPELADLTASLAGRLEPTVAPAAADVTRGLFARGLIANAMLGHAVGDAGADAVRVEILDRAFWLDATGRLAPAAVRKP